MHLTIISSPLSSARLALFVFAVTLACFWCVARAEDDDIPGEIEEAAQCLEIVWFNIQHILSLFAACDLLYTMKPLTQEEQNNFISKANKKGHEIHAIFHSEKLNPPEFVNVLSIRIPRYDDIVYSVWCNSSSATLKERQNFVDIIVKSFTVQSLAIVYHSWLQKQSNINVLWSMRDVYSFNLLQLQQIFETINEMNTILMKLNRNIDLLEKLWITFYESLSHKSSSDVLTLFSQFNLFRTSKLSPLLLESWEILQILRGVLYAKIPQSYVDFGLSPRIKEELYKSEKSFEARKARFSVSYQLLQVLAHIKCARHFLTKAHKQFGFLIFTITHKQRNSQTSLNAMKHRSKFSYNWTEDLKNVERMFVQSKKIRSILIEKYRDKGTFNFLKEFPSQHNDEEIVQTLSINLDKLSQRVTTYRASLRNRALSDATYPYPDSIEEQLNALGQIGIIWSNIRDETHGLVQLWTENYFIEELFYVNEANDGQEAQRLSSKNFGRHIILKVFISMKIIDLTLENFKFAVESSNQFVEEWKERKYPYHLLQPTQFTSQKQHSEK